MAKNLRDGELSAIMDQSKENTEFKKFFPQMKDDRYEYLGHLGKGRAGQVFKARDKLLKKNIVIKVMCSEIPRQEDFQRFQREARAFSSLQHPNILRVLDFGLAADETPYLVTDFIDGITVADYQKKHKRFTVQETIDIGIQMCDAMAHSHNRGVLHRDLKPSNILLTDPGAKRKHVFILDFGLAKFTDNHPTKDHTLTRPGQLLGTPEYMSPEQARGGQCDERSDIYSLGCILFEMAVGKPPFEAAALLEVVRMQCEDPPPVEKLEAVAPDSGLSTILEKALAKDREERFVSMAEMALALKELVNPSTIETDKSSTQESDKAKSNTEAEKEPVTGADGPTQGSTVGGAQASQRKLKVLPVAGLSLVLFCSAVFLFSSLIKREGEFDPGKIEADEHAPIGKISRSRQDAKPSRSEDLVKDAMIISGRMEGTHLTLSGTLGTDALAEDATRSGKTITLVDASRAHMTDKGLSHLLMINPASMILTGTSITDNGILQMKGNQVIRHLFIDDTRNINGTALKVLPTLPNLQILAIGSERLTQQSLSPLTNCARLNVLCINGSPNLSDDIFIYISRIPELSSLYLGGCPELSPEGIAGLKKSKPYLKIEVSNRAIPLEQIGEMKVVLGDSNDYGFLD